MFMYGRGVGSAQQKHAYVMKGPVARKDIVPLDPGIQQIGQKAAVHRTLPQVGDAGRDGLGDAHGDFVSMFRALR